MDISLFVGIVFIAVCAGNCLLTIICLIIVIIYRKYCFNFSTLLACNTVIGILIASANMTAISVQIYIWGQPLNLQIDPLCELRGYFLHSQMAYVHYSFVLIAMDKYFIIKKINTLKTTLRKVSLCLLHWTLVFLLPLPMLLTGNIVKMSADYICIVTFSRLHLLAIQAFFTFFVPDMTLMFLYCNLVKFVRASSLRVDPSCRQRASRNLTLVRRIVQLNFLIVVTSVLSGLFIVLKTIRPDWFSSTYIRLAFILGNAAWTILIIVLFRIIPGLRRSTEQLSGDTFNFLTRNTSQVVPIRDCHRF